MPSVGGALSLGGSLLGSKKSSDGAKAAAKASQFVPYNISSGIADGAWSGYSGNVNLTPEYQSKRDYYLDQADFFNNQLNAFRPPVREDFISGYDGVGDTSAFSGLFSDLNWESPKNRITQANFSDMSFVQDPETGALIAIGTKKGSSRDDVFAQLSEIAGTATSSEDFLRKVQAASNEGNNYANSAFGTVAGVQPNASRLDRGRTLSTLDADDFMSALEQYQKGSAIYDEGAYQSARENWKSPEQVIFDRLAKIAEPGEALQRSSLENRLFSQGMLGSTGGQHRSKALNDALFQKGLEREHMSVSLAEQIQNMIQARGINATQQALGIDQAGLDNLRLGAAVGTSGASAGANAGRFLNEAAQNSGDAISAAFSSFGNKIDGLFTDPSTPPLVPETGGFGIPSDFVQRQRNDIPDWWLS